MKKAVITGATSMLGLATIDECLKNGIDKIYAVVRESSPNFKYLPNDERVEKVYCDLCNYDQLFELMNDTCDVFYHMAWKGNGAQRNASVARQSDNIGYTLEALRLAKRLGCAKFIATGSQAEYGISDLDK